MFNQGRSAFTSISPGCQGSIVTPSPTGLNQAHMRPTQPEAFPPLSHIPVPLPPAPPPHYHMYGQPKVVMAPNHLPGHPKAHSPNTVRYIMQTHSGYAMLPSNRASHMPNQAVGAPIMVDAVSSLSSAGTRHTLPPVKTEDDINRLERMRPRSWNGSNTGKRKRQKSDTSNSDESNGATGSRYKTRRKNRKAELQRKYRRQHKEMVSMLQAEVTQLRKDLNTFEPMKPLLKIELQRRLADLRPLLWSFQCTFPEGKILEVSPECKRALGYDMTEHCGWDFVQGLIDDPAEVAKEIQDLTRDFVAHRTKVGAMKIYQRAAIVKGEKRWLWVEGVARLISDPSAHPLIIEHVEREISPNGVKLLTDYCLKKAASAIEKHGTAAAARYTSLPENVIRNLEKACAHTKKTTGSNTWLSEQLETIPHLVHGKLAAQSTEAPKIQEGIANKPSQNRIPEDVMAQAREAMHSSNELPRILKTALIDMMKDICTRYHFVLGNFYKRSNDTHLTSTDEIYWISDDLAEFGSHDTSRAKQYWQLSLTFDYRKGEGMPGRVWNAMEYEWAFDVIQYSKSFFPRRDLAHTFNMKACCCVPICLDKSSPKTSFLGCVEFFAPGARPPNHRMIQEILEYPLILDKSFRTKKPIDTDFP